MPDPATRRALMVATQLRANEVTDARVRAAMGTIPRELFVPERLRTVAYVEDCLPLKAGRVLLDPRSFAKLIQLAAIRPRDVVLDVGCATGYSTAVLSLIAARVVGLEEDAELAARAEENLKVLALRNAIVIRGALARGCPEQAPFDVIVLEGAIEQEPEALLMQLKDGGRLVAIACMSGAGQARLYVRNGRALSERSAFDAQVPVLPGFAKPKSFVF